MLMFRPVVCVPLRERPAPPRVQSHGSTVSVPRFPARAPAQDQAAVESVDDAYIQAAGLIHVNETVRFDLLSSSRSSFLGSQSLASGGTELVACVITMLVDMNASAAADEESLQPNIFLQYLSAGHGRL